MLLHLKEMRNSCFWITSQNQAPNEVTLISQMTQKKLTTDTFPHMKLLIAIISFLKIFCLKKDLFIFFNNSEKLQENQSPNLRRITHFF